jgi:hypothetical protein
MKRIGPVTALLVFCSGSPVLAQETPAPESNAANTSAPEGNAATTPAPEAPPSWNETNEWGYIIIGSSLALGAALATSGLAEECRGDHGCRVEKSEFFWGGIGLATTGSMLGFVILENARDWENARAATQSAWAITVRGSF